MTDEDTKILNEISSFDESQLEAQPHYKLLKICHNRIQALDMPEADKEAMMNLYVGIALDSAAVFGDGMTPDDEAAVKTAIEITIDTFYKVYVKTLADFKYSSFVFRVAQEMLNRNKAVKEAFEMNNVQG